MAYSRPSDTFRNNPQVKHTTEYGIALIVFLGAQGYASPSWLHDGRHAPSWNFEMVQYVANRQVRPLARGRDRARRQADRRDGSGRVNAWLTEEGLSGRGGQSARADGLAGLRAGRFRPARRCAARKAPGTSRFPLRPALRRAGHGCCPSASPPPRRGRAAPANQVRAVDHSRHHR